MGFTFLLCLLVGEEFCLSCGDTLAVEFIEPGLPFVDQLQRLSATPLGASKHSLGMGSLFF